MRADSGHDRGSGQSRRRGSGRLSLFVGTSGFAYKEWKGGFYPADLPQRAFLDYYASQLTACEINATFYRLQSSSTFERWRGEVPSRFRFVVKAHRRLTHRKQFAPEEGSRNFAERFVASLTPLESQLGCVLLQFPPYVRRDDDSLQALLDSIPRRLAFACEFRDESWQSVDVEQLVAKNGGTICVAETEGTVPQALPRGPLAYVRLRSQRYSSKARAGWLELLEAEARSRDVYAFAKHEGVPAGDSHGGVGFARWLVEAST